MSAIEAANAVPFSAGLGEACASRSMIEKAYISSHLSEGIPKVRYLLLATTLSLDIQLAPRYRQFGILTAVGKLTPFCGGNSTTAYPDGPLETYRPTFRSYRRGNNSSIGRGGAADQTDRRRQADKSADMLDSGSITTGSAYGPRAVCSDTAGRGKGAGEQAAGRTPGNDVHCVDPL